MSAAPGLGLFIEAYSGLGQAAKMSPASINDMIMPNFILLIAQNLIDNGRFLRSRI